MNLSLNKSQSSQDCIGRENAFILDLQERFPRAVFYAELMGSRLLSIRQQGNPPAHRRYVIREDPRVRQFPTGLIRELGLLKQHTLLAYTAGKPGLASLQTLPTSGCCCRHIRIS